MISETAKQSETSSFRTTYSRDRQRGRRRSLTEYLKLFPQDEIRLAEDFVAFEKDWSESGVTGSTLVTESGSRINTMIGDYRILEEIGRGGQGRVYLAKDTKLRRQVAIKILENCGDSKDLAFARYRREIEALSRINHRGICPVYDGGIFEDQAYIAMRLVEGQSLREFLNPDATLGDGEESAFFSLSSCDLSVGDAPIGTDKIARKRTPKTRVELMEQIRLIERTARALHAAHMAGIAHGDIKPANIMIDSDGRPVLLDFGLARNAEEDAASLTRTAGLHGTPAYMAPELIKGKRISSNRATDIYALGVTLFECLTGKRPFEAANRQALYHAILEVEAPKASTINDIVPKDLDVIIQTAMGKDPKKRYQSALDFAEDLRRLREYEPIRARPATSWTKLSRWSRRNPGLAASLSAIFFLLVLSLGFATHFLQQEETQRAKLAGVVANLEIEQREKESAIAALNRERQAKEAFFDLAVDLLNKAMHVNKAQGSASIAEMLSKTFKDQLAKAKRAVVPVLFADRSDSQNMDLILPRGKTSNTRPEFEFRVPSDIKRPKEILLTLTDRQNHAVSLPVTKYTFDNHRVKFPLPCKQSLTPGKSYSWSIVLDGKRSPVVLKDGTKVKRVAKFAVAHDEVMAKAKFDRSKKSMAILKHAQLCLKNAMPMDTIRILEKLPHLENPNHEQLKTFILGRAYAAVGDKDKIRALREANAPQ